MNQPKETRLMIREIIGKESSQKISEIIIDNIPDLICALRRYH